MESHWVLAVLRHPFHLFLHKNQVLDCLVVLSVQGVRVVPVFLGLQQDPSVLSALGGQEAPESQPVQALQVHPCTCRGLL